MCAAGWSPSTSGPTCINWLRTVPYVRAWDEPCRAAGLVVLGVHTPEFPFERDVGYVRRAIADRQIGQ
jgi:hypothetical protein